MSNETGQKIYVGRDFVGLPPNRGRRQPVDFAPKALNGFADRQMRIEAPIVGGIETRLGRRQVVSRRRSVRDRKICHGEHGAIPRFSAVSRHRYGIDLSQIAPKVSIDGLRIDGHQRLMVGLCGKIPIKRLSRRAAHPFPRGRVRKEASGDSDKALTCASRWGPVRCTGPDAKADPAGPVQPRETEVAGPANAV